MFPPAMRRRKARHQVASSDEAISTGATTGSAAGPAGSGEIDARATSSNGARAYNENPETVAMSRWRWDAMIQRFEKARSAANFSDAGPWIGMLLATLPPVLADDFELTWLGLGPAEWRAAFVIATLLVLLKILTVIGQAALRWACERRSEDIKVFGMVVYRRPADWVPNNVADFVELVVRQIQEEAVTATR